MFYICFLPCIFPTMAIMINEVLDNIAGSLQIAIDVMLREKFSNLNIIMRDFKISL